MSREITECANMEGVLLQNTNLRLVFQDGMTACCLGVRIQLHHYSEILQWVLLENSALNLFATNRIFVRHGIDNRSK